LPQTVSLGGYLALVDVDTVYDSGPTLATRGLGIAQIDFTDATYLAFTVFFNKTGTGTHSYQLWNVTDGLEIVVVSSAVLGQQTVTVETTDPAVIPKGIVVVRVRVKSTVATDDPTYFGATLTLE
jgi:hypothetical protein